MAVAECGCGGALEVGDDAMGQPLSCPFCSGVFRAVASAPSTYPFTSRLTITAGPDRVGEQFLLGGDGSIGLGKLATNLIRFVTPLVSRNHCELRRTPAGGWEIADRNSTNGLFVNKMRIATHALASGDVVRVGEYEMRFDASAIPMAAQAPVDEEPEVLEEMPGDLVTEGDAPDDLYEMAEPPPVPVSRIVPASAPGATPLVTPAGPAPSCPSCGKKLFPGAKICVDCGIDLKTGRSLVTSKDINEDDLAIRADTWIRIISWVLPLGLFPIASEAFATKKPYVTWAIAAVTILTSAIFFAYLVGNDDPSPQALNFMHWTGSREASDKDAAAAVSTLEHQYLDEAKSKVPGGKLSAETERKIHRQAVEDAGDIRGAPEGVDFHYYQLLTCAFLHDPGSIFGLIMHLGGNMVFFLVFGLRVNEMVGTVRMIILYVFLAVGSSYIDGLSHLHDPLRPSLGASGAIMGLAGMYIVFFPIQRVHMAFWIRIRWHLWYKLFTMRGFWLLALWVGFNDLLPMFLKSEDSVAHWAHLGGFILGVTAALLLLLARQANAGGSDLLSVMLGRRAWALLGKPAAPTPTLPPATV